MDINTKIWLIILLTFMFLTGMLTYLITNNNFKEEAVKHGMAHYELGPDNNIFIWNK